MKLNHSIFLLSLNLATTLTLLSNASPLIPQSHNSNLDPLNHDSNLKFNQYSSDQLYNNIPSSHSPQKLSNPHLASSLNEGTPKSSKIVSTGKTPYNNNRRSPNSVRSSSSSSSNSSPSSNTKKKRTKSLFKRAPPPPSLPNSASLPSNIPNTPLLILPGSHSVWQAGSYQTVQWSLAYKSTVPKDTTVDIVLVDSKTNRKISSLKRFVPFKKGSTQVWVPANLPEGISFVLVLELYRGKSQEQVTSTQHSSQEKPKYPPPTSTDVFSTVVRRSDINISSKPNNSNNNNYNTNNNNNNNHNNEFARDSKFPSSSGNSNGPVSGGAFGTSKSGAHHDINNDDYYTGSIIERPFDFSPQEMREEYPNTIRPLELYHTFGLHQKVYTSTPYTLEWKIPERIKELLDYTHLIQSSIINKSNQGKGKEKQQLAPKSVFLAKILVELVTDQTLETIAVLARDIPAEAMFQYLSIQGHVPQAFYRLRVQMVVVEVKYNPDSPTSLQVPPLSSKSKPGMEGWEFPDGGTVIDRYESVTRRFWASQGAL